MTTWRVAIWILIIGLAASGCRRECSRSLVDEFPRAKLLEETWLIDLGLPDQRKHLISGWSADEQWGAERTSFVWSTGRSAVIHFDRYGNSDVRLRFRCRPNELPGRGRQTVTTVLNGVPLGTTALQSDFANYELSVPARRLRVGANRVEFLHGYRGPDTRELAIAWDWIELIERGNKPNEQSSSRSSDSIVIPYRSAVRFRVEIRPDSALAFDAIEDESGMGAEDRGRLQVILRADNSSIKFDAVPNGEARRFEIPHTYEGNVNVDIIVLPPAAGAGSLTAVRLRRPRLVTAGPCRK